MLLNDKKKTVELLLENILWGDVYFDTAQLVDNKKDVDNFHDEVVGIANRWRILNNKNDSSEEFEKLTNEIYGKFFRGRFYAVIKGKMRDRNEETLIEKLIDEKNRLVGELSQAYVPPKDTGVGTN